MAHLFLLAQSAVDVARSSGVARYAPLVIMALFFALLVYWMRQSRISAKPIYDRSIEHMGRIEAKTDEMIALLREIRDKLSNGD